MEQSQRVKGLPSYLFARVNALRAESRSRGVDVIDLGMGNPDRPTPPHILNKLVDAIKDPKTHRYSTSRGITNLRKAISYWYGIRYGVEIDPEKEALSVIGSKEGIIHLAFALLDPGDVVLAPTPTYPVHAFSVSFAGGKLISFPVEKTKNFVAELEKCIPKDGPKPKMLMLN